MPEPCTPVVVDVGSGRRSRHRRIQAGPAVRLLIGLSLIGVLAPACTATGGGTASTTGAPTGSDDDVVLVFAAASLTDVFSDLERSYEAENPTVDIQLNLAGSSTLREQILAGAPADVFAPAAAEPMDEVVAADLAVGQPLVVAHNRLALAVPPGNPGGVTGWADLADDRLLVGLCAPGVPCGDLARRLLADAGVVPSIDTEEPDVRALLTRIEAGELDVGVIYTTDVMAAGDRVETVKLDEADTAATQAVTNDYPIATLSGGTNPSGAADFVAFVLSDEGRDLLAERGFEPA